MSRNKTIEQWMPFHVLDYLQDTLHLSTVEHGAYLLLLITAWTRGAELPDDDESLAQITRLPLSQWRRIRPRLDRFFSPLPGGGLTQKRLAAEYERAKTRSDSYAARGRKGGRPTSCLTSGDQTTYQEQGHETIAHPPDKLNESYSFPPALHVQNVQLKPNPKLGFAHKRHKDTDSDPSGSSSAVGEESPTTPQRARARPRNLQPEERLAAKQVLAYLNDRAGTAYETSVDALLVGIVDLIRAGATQQHFEAVINRAVERWADDPERVQYLRPATLFDRTLFWNYAGGLTHSAECSPWSTWSGIVQTGAQYGLEEESFDSSPAFRSAVIAAAEKAGHLTRDQAEKLREQA